jgi:outer membrane immunogenic protein
MNKIALAVAAASVMFAGAASAADMAARPYTKAPPPVIAPPCVWCGFYIGVNAGGTWDRNDATYTQFPSLATASTRLDTSGFIGGGQVGYNWQWNNFVLGIEGDAAWRDRTASARLLPFAPGNVDDVVNVSNRQGWLATIRPRAGVAFNNALFYVTGGVAFGEVSHSYQELRLSTGQNRLFTDTDTRTGWTAGVGAEYKFVPNWSIGVEYLHVDLGSTTIASPASVSGGLPFPASQVRFENKSDIVRAKINYHFGGPVVAKY